VTWDEHSLKIHGERIFIFSGEIHPYRYVGCWSFEEVCEIDCGDNSTMLRMPVHSLYLDVFQKVKAMGFNAVSFYTFW